MAALKRRRTGILMKSLLQSAVVLTGAFAWIALFRINDPLALSEAWKSMISMQGIFLAFMGFVAGIISHILISSRYRIVDEALIAFLLIMMAGLAEAWGMGLRPAFLPALIMVIYLQTKVWMSYSHEIKFIKRVYR